MKIVKKIGNFVIKETNESERASNWHYNDKKRSDMDNFYLYHKDHSASKFVDEYITTADTLEEAIERAECEIAKSKCDLSLVAKEIERRLIGVDLTASAEELHKDIIETVTADVNVVLGGMIPFDVHHRVNYLSNTHEIIVETDIEPYADVDTMLFKACDTTEISFKLRLIGTYDSRCLKYL